MACLHSMNVRAHFMECLPHFHSAHFRTSHTQADPRRFAADHRAEFALAGTGSNAPHTCVHHDATLRTPVCIVMQRPRTPVCILMRITHPANPGTEMSGAAACRRKRGGSRSRRF
eukprot:2010847-Rhodomonas_salina.2